MLGQAGVYGPTRGQYSTGGPAIGRGPQVYWGTETYEQKIAKRGRFERERDELDGGQRGEAMLGDLDDRSNLRKQMINLGIITDDTDLRSNTIDQVWAMAMEFSANAYAKGQKLTPWDILKRLGGSAGRGGGGGGAAAPFSGTRTTTSRNVVLTDEKTAKALVKSVLQDQLGRDASDDEFKDFVGKLHAAEKKNAAVTTTSTTYKAGVATSSTSTTKGGLDAPGKQEVLEDRLEDDPELKAEREAQRKVSYVQLMEQLNGMGDL